YTYRKLDEGDMAAREFSRAVAIRPDLLIAALNLGDLLSASGDYAQAENVYHIAYVHSPSSAPLLNNLGVVQSLQGKYGDAIQSFEEALAIQPDLAISHYGLGMSLMKVRSYQRAGDEFKQAALLNPNLLDATQKMELCFKASSEG